MPWTTRFATMPPVVVFLVVAGGLLLAEFLGYIVSRPIDSGVDLANARVQITISTAIGMFLWLGYPVVISICLFRKFGSVARIKFRWLIAALGCAAAGQLVSMFISLWMWPNEAGIALLVNLVTIPALTGSLYTVWTAARALVYAEEGHAVSFNRVIGTFFMFMFFPVGVFYLQRRFNSLSNGDDPS